MKIFPLKGSYPLVANAMTELTGDGSPSNPGAGTLTATGLVLCTAMIESLGIAAAVRDRLVNQQTVTFPYEEQVRELQEALAGSLTAYSNPERRVAPAMAAFDAAIAGYGGSADHLAVAQHARAKLHSLCVALKLIPQPSNSFEWLMDLFEVKPPNN